MTRLLTNGLLLACVLLSTGEGLAQDPDCTRGFVGQVRSEFTSELAAAEVVKVFVILTKRVTNPAGTTEFFVACNAPDVGKDAPTADHDPGWEVDEWKPEFYLVNDPDPVPKAIAAAPDEFYPTTRPYLDQDRSFIGDDKGWKVYPEDLGSPNCVYYYQNGDRKRYCW